ncbi:MAG TPA: YceI family protein [Anaerolineales bacterium]|nr:YceI family protein [Anaerolineales bacterium]
MKNRILSSIISVVLLVLVVSPSHAGVRSWEIDKDHANFYFSVEHIYAKVQGRFTDYKGAFLFDPDNLNESKISFEIKVNSVDTGISKRDKHLPSNDFLDAAKYPLITFISSSITKTGENIYNVKGKLTIKDVTSDLTIPLEYFGKKEHPLLKGMEVAGFNGRVILDRLNYHVGDDTYYKMGVVGKDVDVLITLELLRKKE